MSAKISVTEAKRLLEKEDPQAFEAQSAAMRILLQAEEPGIAQFLSKIIKSYENPILLALAVTLLSEIGSQEAIEILTKLLFEEPRLPVQRLAARALGYSRQASALPALKRILERPVTELESLPVVEALWAVNSLVQLEIVSLDAECIDLLSKWQQQAGEVGLLARLSLQKQAQSLL